MTRFWFRCPVQRVGFVVLLVWVIGCNGLLPSPDESDRFSPAAELSDGLSGSEYSDPKTYALRTPRLVALGDSLTAGLGISSEDAYPSRLQERLDSSGYQLEVVNAGVSGDTSAGGLRRLDWSLEREVAILLVALGGNDGLRGLPVDQLKSNLSEIITTAQALEIEVILAGMEAPPNFGTTYTEAFRLVYKELALEYDVPLVPFLLEGVAGVPELNQPDGIHPNPRGAQMVADHLWPAIEAMALHLDFRASS